MFWGLKLYIQKYAAKYGTIKIYKEFENRKHLTHCLPIFVAPLIDQNGKNSDHLFQKLASSLQQVLRFGCQKTLKHAINN